MRNATGARRVALYGRVSIERTERSKSVDDQLAELRQWAEREEWTITGTYRDDGLSASRYANGRARPGWQRAMDAVNGGDVDALLVWEISRASRDRPVFAALFAACADSDVQIGTGGRLHDLTDADDGFILDLGAALAVRESAVISKRTRRAAESRAAAGRPAGSVPYGYRRVVDPDTGHTIGRALHPEQGPIVAEIVRRLLTREPANAIAADLNRRGVPTATGKQWRPGNLRILALRPTYARLRVHHGQVLEGVRGTWPAIITEDEHDRLVEMFKDPARDKFRNPTYARHLGTGIFRCGREGCDGRMRVVAQSVSGKGHHRPPSYSCRVCHKVSRTQTLVDDLVEMLIVRRLSRPDVVAELEQGDDPGVAEAAAEAARLKLKLRAARQAWDDDQLSLEEYTDMRARTEPKIRAAEQRARPRHVPQALIDVASAGAEAAEKWAVLPIGDRRAIVAALADVTILPAGRGKWKFDPDGVTVKWRSGPA
ncbi:MAG: hypothetical protein JWO67_3980 [Streptosporangiaceae bacterium]|nr:hypothetical protein [Streptosporangiaceae bacterium]